MLTAARILLDTDIAKPKLRWNEAHEITHDILPWHYGIAHGDPEATLSPACHEQIEAEANYGAGRLLFCGSEFLKTVRDSALSFEFLKELHGRYGNTMTTTLWRIVEATQHPAFGIVSVHPAGATGNVYEDVRYFIRSRRFAREFSRADPSMLFDTICTRCYGRRGPVGQGILLVSNDRDEASPFTFETFWNGYDALTLAHHP